MCQVYNRNLNYWKAVASGGAGKFDFAIKYADAYLDRSPEEERSWDIAARVYALARRNSPKYLEQTIRFFRRLVQRETHSAQAWGELGFSLWAAWHAQPERRDLAEELIGALRRALDLGVEDEGLANDRIAHVYQALGQPVMAEEYYRRAAAISSDPFSCCLADFLVSEDRFDQALPLFRSFAREQGTGCDHSQSDRALLQPARQEQRSDRRVRALDRARRQPRELLVRPGRCLLERRQYWAGRSDLADGVGPLPGPRTGRADRRRSRGSPARRMRAGESAQLDCYLIARTRTRHLSMPTKLLTLLVEPIGIEPTTS